ncbi:MAG: hypothetical protein C6I00_05195 [Nitratiruptor sp.]|nr:hypothetical protein [Nitratiruptor sp.]NPA83494.1 hypothetical protein [Campylobacterota bacterium]
MRRAIFLFLFPFALLYGGYLEELLHYLTSKSSFPINGKFYPYDFDRDGTIAPDEWIYISLPERKGYRLLATPPSPKNAFGFAPIPLPPGLQEDKPAGYFIYVDFPKDPDPRFSWLYVTATKPHLVYKLIGATPENTFAYLDLDGDGHFDPLPNLAVELKGDWILLSTPKLPGAVPSPTSQPEETPQSTHPLDQIVTDRGYTLLAWNDLGMHCMDDDYSIFSILPPYNTLNAQLIKRGTKPQLITQGVTITYEAFPSLDGVLNSYSAGKTNFWRFVTPLYHKSPPPNIGLTGFPTPSRKPTPMRYDPTHGWWSAEGLPITPIDDDGGYNPYPLVAVKAWDEAGNLLAQTITTLPVSTEMDCRSCHSPTSSNQAAMPEGGWIRMDDPIKEYRLNILRLHDQHHPEAVRKYAERLEAKGYTYDPQGLEATARANTPILCASCHQSNALPGSGIKGILPLTQAIHTSHAQVKEPTTGQPLNQMDDPRSCYACHPGKQTRCLRGAMGKEGISCQDCHGTMSAVGSKNRQGWLDEPNCQSCHQGGKRYEVATIDRYRGTLREALDMRFATNPNTPLPGKSLYRFSKGHGKLACAACHGSPHAIYPSAKPEDNLQSIGIQGHEGTIAECTSCHSQVPATGEKGPHGLHSVGTWWLEEHGEYAERNLQRCASCHGEDYRGGPLAKTFATRIFFSEYGRKVFQAGHEVSCYDCHNGPYGEDGEEREWEEGEED